MRKLLCKYFFRIRQNPKKIVLCLRCVFKSFLWDIYCSVWRDSQMLSKTVWFCPNKSFYNRKFLTCCQWQKKLSQKYAVLFFYISTVKQGAPRPQLSKKNKPLLWTTCCRKNRMISPKSFTIRTHKIETMHSLKTFCLQRCAFQLLTMVWRLKCNIYLFTLWEP